ncbi:low molecular weight protein arginine phosphatase [Clostridium botulinum]|uniref:Low molecular weight protein-tyrosine-phosphatase n=1 Tax=Clostridium botulinum (strain Hall / ATCC 3502 / NCTC 13319 / Type A) TaxID=441771 RepID=A5HY39_CLOBH|nr:low molecular weight protein arginine phosphatase [Clostridium botulinum]ABS34532.1 low molecular weight protein tyrosine phosphatase [Clostridium botulinum A str. ATCC 19397]ABS36904.1 low molecular weight protein tyrosine phosphatase [Clostridium botulinum A str. Hall]AWB16064.1 low molecular weight protein arginine phosphatase [Clostridium botulinum]AWB28882.1 low molecular weight protein arginine phosphatase [Clostridium botulinum]EGT5615140.1 low molecular weight protein arginine phosp
MNILFVCTGNTCRSFMAEAIFNSLNNMEELTAKSAGIAVVPGSVSSSNACKIINEDINVDLSNREAIQLDEEILDQSDLILTMTYSAKDLLSNLSLEDSDRIFCITEYVGQKGEILDPFGGDIEVYKNTYEQLKNIILLLLKKLKEDRQN